MVSYTINDEFQVREVIVSLLACEAECPGASPGYLTISRGFSVT